MKMTSRNRWAVILASAAALLACGGHNPTATPASAPSANRIAESDNASKWPVATDRSGVRELAGATVVMDSAHKIRYLNGKRPFNCKNGTKATEDMLIAVYDAGNTLRKPVGSGWYAAELEAGVCGVSQAGLYGCKFDVGGTHRVRSRGVSRGPRRYRHHESFRGARNQSSNHAAGGPGAGTSGTWSASRAARICSA